MLPPPKVSLDAPAGADGSSHSPSLATSPTESAASRMAAARLERASARAAAASPRASTNGATDNFASGTVGDLSASPASPPVALPLAIPAVDETKEALEEDEPIFTARSRHVLASNRGAQTAAPAAGAHFGTTASMC